MSCLTSATDNNLLLTSIVMECRCPLCAKATIFEQPVFVPKWRSRHSSTAALIGFKNENGYAARSPRLQGPPLNHPSRRLRPVVTWWLRVAGITARDDATRAGPDGRITAERVRQLQQ